MSETNKLILEMIKQNKSIEEISEVVKLSYRQLFNRISSLENQGYEVKRKYCSSGNLTYTFSNDNSYHLNDSFELFNDAQELKLMVISDLHIGNIKSDEEALNTIYNHCAKNGIHIIIICGDIIDGTYSQTEMIVDPEKQIEHLIKIYPFDKSILNLYSIGDHDSSISKKGMSLALALNKRRHDICPLSNQIKEYQTDKITINTNNILVSHKAPVFEEKKVENYKLHLIGHNHCSKTLVNLNKENLLTPRIHIPPLAHNSIPGETNIPRAVELTIHMDKKLNFRVIQKKDLLILNDKTINVSEALINYKKENVNPFKLSSVVQERVANNEVIYKDENKDKTNENYIDDQGSKKDDEIGKLNKEQKQMVKDFFGKTPKIKKNKKVIY